jgi:uncharacterized protein (TIGR03086 family)
VDQLSEAVGVADGIIANVGDEQWSDPTPCTEWNVRELVAHVVAGNERFVSFLDGRTPEAPTPIAGNEVHAFRDSARRLVAAFAQPGALERIVTVPIGQVPGIVALHLRVTELLVHGWDLAWATGQHVTFPDALVDQELRFTVEKLSDVPADRRPFAAPRPVADDAPVIDRLAALLGRDVSAVS